MNTIIRFFIIMLLCAGLLAGCGAKMSAEAISQANYIDAQEMKLKVRELADQMLGTVPNDSLTGLVAVPTSFVNQDNLQASSSFGRLISESLIYEFNQRGFPVREYRAGSTVSMKEGLGEFVLNRSGSIKSDEKWAALIVGTYYRDKDAIFVNARMVRATDGMVLRTAQLVLKSNTYVDRLTGPTYVASNSAIAGGSTATGSGGAVSKNTAIAKNPGPLLSSGSLNIKPNPNPASRRMAVAKNNRTPGLWGPPID